MHRSMEDFTTLTFDSSRAMMTMHKSVLILLSTLLIANALPLVIAEEGVVTETPRSSAPSSVATTAKGLQGYSRFHANDSLVGLTIPCTHDEKICFRYNLLFDVENDHCRPIGHGYHCHLRVNRTEFEHGSGHVVGICENYEDLCSGYLMAYDGRCHRKEVVRDVICGCDAEPTGHFLGGKECRCTPPTPIHVEQPEEEGRCRIPDFRFPDDNHNSSRYENWVDFHELNCSFENFMCFYEQKVWVPEGKGCFKVLERGPCAEDHIVVLDSVAAREEGRAEARCAHERGHCPQGHVRMAFDGQCYTKRDIELVVSGLIGTNAFGETSATTYGFNIQDLTIVGTNMCVLGVPRFPVPASPAFGGNIRPLCGSNDNSQCSHYEVESDIPKPE